MTLTPANRLTVCCFLFSVLFCACASDEQQAVRHQLTVFETSGYTPPPDSVTSPQVVPLSETDMQVLQAGATKPIPAHTNRFTALAPVISIAGVPKVAVPGKDSTLSPLSLVLRDSAIDMRGIEMVVAKDMAVKDPNPDNFSFYTKLQGLKHPAITSLIQDQAGNIWIASRSGGLSRFDGKNFMHILEMLKGGARRVLSMMEDREGNIWFGAETPGIYKYDGRRIVHLYDTALRCDGYLQCLMQDKAGNIWIGSRRNGLFRYDGKKMQQYTTKQGLTSNNIRSLLQDNKGNIWIGTIGGGLLRYDGNTFQAFTTQSGLPAKGILSLLQDNHGQLWMGTDSSGVIRYDGQSFAQYTTKQGLSNNGILSLLQDDLGNMWMGTDGSGAIRFDGNTFEYFGDAQGFPNKEVRSIIKDRSGNIWFGNYGSLARLSSFPFTHFTDRGGLLYNQNWSLLHDKKGNTWMGSSMGLCKYDGTNFTSYTRENGLPAVATVRSLDEAKDGRLLIGFGSGGGFAYFDGNQFLFYRDTSAPNENAVQDIITDSKGNTWLANYQGGLYKYDGKTLTKYTTRQGLSSNSVNCVDEDNKGNIWIGTTDGGINKFDGKQFTHYTTSHGIPNSAVWSSHRDKAGNMWFGTEGGVVRYDGKKFTLFGEMEGMSAGYALSMTEDLNGDMWFSTRNGLNRLPKADAQRRYDEQLPNEVDLQNLFKMYGYADGYLGLGGQSGRTILTDRYNNIWACSNDRVSVYHKSREVVSKEPPKARLTAIQLYNEPIDWSVLEKNKDSSFLLSNGVRVKGLHFDSVSKWHRLPQSLSLASDNNYLGFQFIGITMHQADRVKYQYTLEGNDKGWSGWTTNDRASYGNLAPGKYTFKLKAKDSNGDLSNEYTYSFRIRPPWWQAWWAYIFYALLMMAGLKWLHNYQRQRVIRSERLRAERKELEQARAIEKAYAQLELAHNNLKETQAQLVHSEKMASLGELTAGIAHEIQNPLNFINNFSEVNKELLDELKEELAKGNVEEAKTLADDVIGNEEKIIFHGRRADGIVKGMLQHSRSSSGTKEVTNINGLCEEYLRLAYHGLRAKDKSFNSKFEMVPDDTIGEIRIIPQDMGRVILNLINNAFYAVSAKRKLQLEGYEPAVTISTRNLGDNVQISVTDNGTGIPQKALEKIFQPFFTTKPTGEGTGLGLSLSYDIVTKVHGGDLKVETKEGEGTTFIITLPKQQA